MAEIPKRMNYDESQMTSEMKWLEEGEMPPLPARKPSYDDEEPLGLNFFELELQMMICRT